MTPPLTLQPNCPQESVAANKSASTQIFGVMYITLTRLIDSMVPPQYCGGPFLLSPWAVCPRVLRNPPLVGSLTIPAGFIVFNNVLVTTKQYNFLSTHRILNPPLIPKTTKIPNIVIQHLSSAEIGTFSGLHSEHANLWIQSTQNKFTQLGYPRKIWASEIALHITGASSHFVSNCFD
ncbi:hypothetical protein DSO57_1033622 [Entomophthora muscae]|uniref:Uncharacterized protein n=1 Tax=Entomophthora muscae TaxID=34485 RepID=A0ACC2SCZ9_9FUNG|nr:hypothetical protein DSO57_1033622 [Entomophthora muscae]